MRKKEIATYIASKVIHFLPYYKADKKFVRKKTIGFLFGCELRSLTHKEQKEMAETIKKAY